ncbi:MAG: ATP-binding protein [Novosphingobium sp.]
MLSDGRAGFPEFLETAEGFLDRAGAPSDVTTKVMIVLDELVSNILDHGSAGQITLRLHVVRGAVTAELTDNGAAFDPLSLPDPDTSLSVEDRPVGGLGIHIVRKLMDLVEYSHDGNCNRLRFAKNYPVES